jgi:type I restriction enzyme S subunit
MSNEMAVINIVVPPLKEQLAISNYLDQKTSKIDAIVNNIGSQINHLKELRKSLINDVVTGKIKVI